MGLVDPADIRSTTYQRGAEGGIVRLLHEIENVPAAVAAADPVAALSRSGLQSQAHGSSPLSSCPERRPSIQAIRVHHSLASPLLFSCLVHAGGRMDRPILTGVLCKLVFERLPGISSGAAPGSIGLAVATRGADRLGRVSIPFDYGTDFDRRRAASPTRPGSIALGRLGS